MSIEHHEQRARSMALSTIRVTACITPATTHGVMANIAKNVHALVREEAWDGWTTKTVAMVSQIPEDVCDDVRDAVNDLVFRATPPGVINLHPADMADSPDYGGW